MATVATYAQLAPPKQFVPLPNVNVTFGLQYSTDLVSKYATLIIDGYTETVVDSGHTYSGYKITNVLTQAIGGQWYTEYVINSTLLGEAYPQRGTSDVISGGKMQARVEIGDELDGNGYVTNPVFISNTVLVDMIITRSDPAYFLHTPYYSTSSTFNLYPFCDYIFTYGANGNDDVQSYRIFLYDNYHNLIFDSEELYDWDSNIYGNSIYTLYDLQNDTTYYTRLRVTLNGGYVFWSEYTPIVVQYADIPAGSDNFVLIPQMGTVKMQIDLTNVTHTRVVFSRSLLEESSYLEIIKTDNPSAIVCGIDKYPIPNKSYIYKAVVYNGSIIVGTYYQTILYQNNYITISDVMGSYSAVASITKHPINRNDRGNILEAMDSKYPYNIINGSADYDSGTIEGMFSTIKDDCTVEMNNKALSNTLRSWLNNGRAKLLSYYTGEAWIVAVNGVSTTDPNNNDIYNTSFNWTEIGDANKTSEYIRLGLVITDE